MLTTGEKMNHHINLTKRLFKAVLALFLITALLITASPRRASAQQIQPNDQEKRSLLLLVREADNLIREAAAITGNDDMKAELRLARRALADESGKPDISLMRFSRSREILRRIIDEQQGEAADFQEKIAEALRRIEVARSGGGAGKATVDTAFGLHTATFETLQGTVAVNLPDDLQAGDTISGTVIAEPSGKSEAEQAKNQSELNGYVVQIEQEEVTTEKQYANLIIPAVATSIPVILKNSKGEEVARLQVRVEKQSGQFSPHQGREKSSAKFPGVGSGSGEAQEGLLPAYQTPSAGQAGKPIIVKGPFDGNYETSRVSIASRSARVLAESPRQVVVQSPSDVVGKANIEVSEQGKTVASSSYQNIAVRLSAEKLNMIRGEQTTLTVTVLGAAEPDTQSPEWQGPITVELVNQTPWVVRMSGGDRQLLLINPQDSPGGTHRTTRTLTGVQAGGFSINATVVANQGVAGGRKNVGLPSPGPDRQPSNPTSASTPIDRRNVNRPEPPLTPQSGELGPDGEPRSSGGSRPVDPFRGRFRVIVNGFTVNHQTADGVFERDGAGDEVTLITYVATVDRGSRFNRIIWGDIFSSVMGAQPQNQVRAGSASGNGGLRTGDSFPSASPARRITPLTTGIPATILFEGELVQGQNAAFILPSLWEWDGLSRRSLQGRFADEMDRRESNIVGFVDRLIQSPPALRLENYLLRGSVLGLNDMATIGFGPLGLGEVNNRPIGMLPVENGFGFTPRVLILTYDAARVFAQTDAGRGRGVIAVNYVDDAALEGSYTMFLQIEQVGGR
jgi:hypothetical protein